MRQGVEPESPPGAQRTAVPTFSGHSRHRPYGWAMVLQFPSSLRRGLAATWLAVAALAPAAVIAPALAAAPVDDLAAVNRAIRAITTLKASFVQTDAKGQVMTGTLLLKQPGHIRFDYGAANLLVVADGKSLHMIDYDVAQVERLPIRNSPLGALLDPGRDLTRYGKLVALGDPRVVTVEVRDSAHPEYGTLSLVFTRKASAPGGLELFGWMMRDAQGNRTSIRLSSLTYGAPIANSAFAWRDPRVGVRGPR
jgi:outer membrane lipoprotein-sorting protein